MLLMREFIIEQSLLVSHELLLRKMLLTFVSPCSEGTGFLL